MPNKDLNRPSRSSYAPETSLVIGGLAKPRSPWDKMPEETDNDFLLFDLYREMSPRIRSVRQMIRNERALRAEFPDAISKVPLSEKELKELSEKYDWAVRAQRWDDYVRHERDIALVSATRDAMEQSAQVALDAMDFNAEFFRMLKHRGIDQGLLGKTDFQTLLRALPNATRSAEVAMKMLRLLGGESTDNLAIRGKLVVAGDKQIDLSNVAPEELRASRDMLSKILKLSPSDLQRALRHAAPEDYVEGEVREILDDEVSPHPQSD